MYLMENWEPKPEWRWWNQSAAVGYIPDSDSKRPWRMMKVRKTLRFSPDFDDIITLDALMIQKRTNCTDGKTVCGTYPWAVRCSLYPCVKTFKSEISLGILKETLLSTIPLRQTNISAIEVTTSRTLKWAIAVNSTIRNGTRHDCLPSDYPTPDTPVGITANMTLPITDTDTKTAGPME